MAKRKREEDGTPDPKGVGKKQEISRGETIANLLRMTADPGQMYLDLREAGCNELADIVSGAILNDAHQKARKEWDDKREKERQAKRVSRLRTEEADSGERPSKSLFTIFLTPHFGGFFSEKCRAICRNSGAIAKIALLFAAKKTQNAELKRS